MKTGVLLHYILDSLGLDEQAIKVILIFYFIAILIFLIGMIASIFNTAQYTKKITEQNEKILEGIATLIEQQSILIEDNEKKEIDNYNNTVYNEYKQQ